jgi:hypothetical protein
LRSRRLVANMQIFVKTLGGGVFCALEVDRRDTIENVMIKLQEKHGCGPGRLVLRDAVKKTHTVLPHNRTVADCRIRPEGHLDYMPILRSGGPGHNVRFPDGRVHNLRKPPQGFTFRSIRELQEAIREQHGIHISLQRLTQEGRECCDTGESFDTSGNTSNFYDLEILPVSCTNKAAFDAEVCILAAAKFAAEAKAAEEATAETLAIAKASEMAQRVRHVVDRLKCNDAAMAIVELSGACALYV